MPPVRRFRAAGAPVLGLGLGLALATPAGAQHAALRHFDVADGLPTPRITSIAEDARGFLWITTPQGVARFDGRGFEVFGEHDGLGRVTPNEAALDPEGGLWIALNGDGLARLRARAPDDDVAGRSVGVFEFLRPGESRAANTVNALRFDAEGRLWLGTEAGLAHSTAPPSRGAAGVEFEWLPDSVACLRPQGAANAADGSLWFVGARGIARVRGGRVTTSALAEPSAHPEYLVVADGRDGTALVGDDRALWRFAPADDGPDTWTRAPLELEPNQGVRALAVDSRGELWIGTTSGLLRRAEGEVTQFTTAQGLPDNSIRCLHAERGGRLWAGTWFGGVVRLGRGEVVSWTRSDAMPNPDTVATFVLADGSVVASTTNDGLYLLDEHGARRLGAELSPRFDRVWTRFVELPGLGFALGTDEGVFAIDAPRLELARARRLDEPDALAGFRPIVMSAGRASGEFLAGDAGARLLRISLARDGSAAVEEVLSASQGATLYVRLRDSVRTLAAAPDGTVWAASRQGLARIRGGRYEVIEPAAGLPTTEARSLGFDARGRLWVALRYDGASVCDDPSAAQPPWRSIAGLREESGFALAATAADEMYVGTASGVYALDARGDVARRFGHASGLASETINHLALDARGRVLAATPVGVTRIDPAREPALGPPPATWITRVEVDGSPLAIPGRAARALGPLSLARDAGMLLVEFSAPWLADEDPLAFELRMNGAETWSAPQREPRVRFANLASGDHEFEVRAVVGAARAAGEPARLRFCVPPPFWRSPWFVAGTFATLAAVAFAWHRVRLRQALALERLRSQIALDLHDELGADLTQVAILAELARRGAAPDTEGAGSLARVAELAREMRTSLADIVWSVDPRRDRLGDLVVRLREIGSQLVEAAGLEFSFQVETDRDVASLPLAPDERRGLYLIVKESLHNAVKHAGAARVDVVLHVAGGRLSIRVRDDGRGFDPRAASTGHGLRGLSTRARALGARLAVESRPGAGTQVEIELSLRGRPA